MTVRALGASIAIAAALLAAPALAQKAPPAPFAPVTEIGLAELPPEARATLALIRKGGPFPYAKDGAIFGNREGVLPRQKRGYYREYTVKTPHERTRGARRIIWGAGGEFYYTEDHYNHFRRIKDKD
jgi:ribonuclease T1